MKEKLGSVLFLVVFGFAGLAQACIWDSKTLWEEKHDHPSLAQAILSPKMEEPDAKSLNNDIQQLNSSPKTNDPAWWNELAGAYLRLGRPSEAVKILEPLTNRFADDYGVHANLGTAYHLLGRFADAEREIRRDTEINTNAHFGLEKYHLALLQYLSRDARYQARHVYVEEFTRCFVMEYGGGRVLTHADLAEYRADKLTEAERKEMEAQADQFLHQAPNEEPNTGEFGNLFFLAMADEAPGYLAKWDLGNDPKLDDGVIYMATLNPHEPACQVMLGLVALKHRDINLAKTAFNNAIQLNSPQRPMLMAGINYLSKFHSQLFGVPDAYYWVLFAIFLVIGYYFFRKWQDSRFKSRAQQKV